MIFVNFNVLPRECRPLVRSPSLLTEILLIPGEEPGNVSFHYVDPTFDPLLCPGHQAADVKVCVDAGEDALKQLMPRAPGGRQDHFFVGRETADETVTG